MIEGVTLRVVRADDAARLFAWANDPVARSVSMRPEPIAWEQHLAWLESSLRDERRHLYIAERDGAPIGTARLDHDAGEPRVAVVSLNVAPEARGRGVGRAVLDALAAQALQLGYERLRALIKVDNETSARAFVATGYALVGEDVVDGAPTRRYERSV